MALLRWLPALLLVLCLLPGTSGRNLWEQLMEDLVEYLEEHHQLHHDHHHDNSTDATDENMSIDQVLMRTNKGRSFEAPTSRSHRTEHISGLDMKLTRAQYQRLHGVDRYRARSADDAILATPWTNGEIPYEIATNDFNADQLAWIHRAMEDWNAMTCVHFRPATPSDTVHKILIRQGAGCWAHLGMIDEYPQIVNLEAGGVGCFWKGLIHHELGHTIGMIHEHQREQRDAYIRVDYYMVMSNMIDAVEKYAKGADTKMGLSYDYKSVMHYGKTAFSSGFYRQTIYTRDPDAEDVIGMTLKPSFHDAKLVNLMYKCADRCHSPPSCPADCFVNQHCECKCENDMEKEDCHDLISDCAARARNGDCINQYGMMHTSCRKTCGICSDDGSVPHLLCVDKENVDCAAKAQSGECQSNFGSMQYDCRKTCGLCRTPDMLPQPGPCKDKNATCRALAREGACYRDMPHMLRDCVESCDFCPEDLGYDPIDKPGCVDYDAGACYYRADSNLCTKYFTLMALKCPVACGQCPGFQVPAGCADTNPECPGWAFRDECENNPGYMLKGCPLSCDQCQGINKPEAGCQDYSLQCADYVHRNECYANANWMLKNCQKSCKNCEDDPPFGVPCMDFQGRCPQWAAEGECENNKMWMWPNCRLSCGQCTPGTVDYNDGECRDNNWECYYWSVKGECEANPGYMLKECPKSCGECTDDGSGSNGGGNDNNNNGGGNCQDNDQECPGWADYGECYANPGYMLINCKQSCQNCKGTCRDDDASCPEWADAGQCNDNPGYMLRNCQQSCNVC